MRLALSLVQRKRGAAQARVQTREALFALLEDEVWTPLEADLRELVAAAVLMPVPAIKPLEAAGFADARDGVARLGARVPFIQPIDDEAFAIHDLFREFVTAHVARTHVAPGHRVSRLGAALVATGSPADGLRLLIEAGDVAGVSEALAAHAFELLEWGSVRSSTPPWRCSPHADSTTPV